MADAICNVLAPVRNFFDNWCCPYEPAPPGYEHWRTHCCANCLDDMKTCLCTWCCPCVIYGENSEMMADGGLCCPSGCIYCLFCSPYGYVGQLWLTWHQRQQIRSRFKIAGDPAVDCCCTVCFPCPILAQHNRELKLRSGKSASP